MNAMSKLEEAFYFFNQMKENVDNKDNFKFNLSAFISSARSTTFFLKKEFDGNPKFDGWYLHKQGEMRANSLMTFFKGARTDEIHIKRVDVEGHHEVSLTDTMSVTDSVQYVLHRADGTIETGGTTPPEIKPNKVKNSSIVKTRWYFTYFNDGEKDIIQLCLEYYNELRKILIEALQVMKL